MALIAKALTVLKMFHEVKKKISPPAFGPKSGSTFVTLTTGIAGD